MFQCDICVLEFLRKDDLLRHIHSVHGEKQFQYSLCSKKFSRHDDLKRHERTLYPKDGFLCNMCNTKVQDKVVFQGHIKAAHSLKCSKCQKIYSN